MQLQHTRLTININLQVLNGHSAIAQSKVVRLPGGDAMCYARPAQVEPFEVSFEQWLAGVQRLQGFAIEPDGSLGLCGHESGVFWQLGGTVYERNGTIYWIDLVGTCSVNALQQFLAACGHPTSTLLLHLNDYRATIHARDAKLLRPISDDTSASG